MTIKDKDFSQLDINKLDDIIISYERPENSPEGYLYFKSPMKLPDGGLNQQVVLTYSKMTLKDLLSDFLTIASINFIPTINPVVLATIASFLAVALRFEIETFPDDYKKLLVAIKETEKGHSIDWDLLQELIEEFPEISDFLEVLESQGLIKESKKTKGKYLILKNMIHLDVSISSDEN